MERELSKSGRPDRQENQMQLVIERGATVPFVDLPPFSLALDGYVQGPAIDLEAQRFSFDHHDACIRMVTRATCQQVLDALLLGLNTEDFTVFLNDVDGDTALSVWLLRNQDRINDPEIRLLVESVGGLDAHGPAYPVLRPELAEGFQEVAMRREGELRGDRGYQTCDLEALLEDCVRDIDAFIAGGMCWEGERKRVDYQVVHQGTGGWVMVESQGWVFRTLYQDGYTKGVTFRQLDGGSWQYSVGKKSDLVQGFPVGPGSQEGTILKHLGDLEPGWGGGSSIGGSPRREDGSSSQMSPDQLFVAIEELLKGGGA
jgi:hypothetical protein